jgi:NodT family efflux transporter outer membrane factor (OMF) lipoprotein
MRHIKRNRFVLSLALALGAAGCEVGPNYRSPKADVPGKFAVTTRPTTNPASLADTEQKPWIEWWTKFNDEKLNSLVSRSLTANHELKIAAARVREARAIERVAQSKLYPTIDLSAAFFQTHGDSAGFGAPWGLPGASSTFYHLGFDATYEVDVFGGVRRSIEAAKAGAEATEDERRGVQVTLLGEVAREYIALRALQTRLDIAKQNLADQRRTLAIVQKRFDNGVAPNFDLVRASAQVDATESSIPPLESGIRQTIYSLSVLLGQDPPALTTELLAAAPIPPVPPKVPVGMPSELLKRRPDVMEAERLVAAATAVQGVATSDLFPHLVLGGAAGVESRKASELFDQHHPSSGFYAVGPLATWTIFDGGRRAANLDRSKAQVAAAINAYEATILRALQDVDSALVAHAHDQARRDSLATLVTENQRAVSIAQSEYSNGIIDLLDVLEVQRNLYASQDALAQATQNVSTDLVALYKALGGGWENPRT